jgi:GT2 family glycosyltransferase
MAESTLERTLDSLTTGNRDVVRRVIVVASPGDGSASIAERYAGVEVLRTRERASAGRARNLGRRAAGDSSYILFLDADCSLAAGSARALLEACDRESLAAAGSPIRSSSNAAVAWIRHLLEFKDFEAGVVSRWPWMLPSAALLCRTEAFDRAGGFPDLWPGEDLVFCERLRVAGLRVRRVESTAVTHEHPRGVARMLIHQFRLGRTSAVARRVTGMQGFEFVRHPWAIPMLFGARLWRSIAWVMRERPRDIGRLAAYFPLVVAGLVSWTFGFARGALREDGVGGAEGAWRGV